MESVNKLFERRTEMEEVNIRDLLNEEIGKEIQALSSLNSGSKEKSTAIDDLTKLYNLRMNGSTMKSTIAG